MIHGFVDIPALQSDSFPRQSLAPLCQLAEIINNTLRPLRVAGDANIGEKTAVL